MLPDIQTEALDFGERAACGVIPGVVLLAVKFEKWLVRQGWLYRMC